MAEKEIRTPEKNKMVCKIRTEDNGMKVIHTKQGKKEDVMSIDQFLTQVFMDEGEMENCG